MLPPGFGQADDGADEPDPFAAANEEIVDDVADDAPLR